MCKYCKFFIIIFGKMRKNQIKKKKNNENLIKGKELEEK